MTEINPDILEFINKFYIPIDKKEVKYNECKICYKQIAEIEDDHKNRHMCEIIPNLFIGDETNSNDGYELNYFKISIIVNTAIEINRIAYHYKLVDYKNVLAYDDDDFKINRFFDDTSDYIHKNINENKILVHCAMGRSRSVSIIIAYLIKYHKMTTDKALEMIKKVRPCAQPNNGFMKQLKEYETKYLNKE
jgi:atypical dual specificity phosphatase